MSYPSKLGLLNLRIRYTGLFDFDGLYNMIVRWLKTNRYWVQETKYKHKVPSPKGAEQEMGFVGTRKVNDYISYDVKVDMHIWEMTEVEIEQKGKKKRLISARIQIEISGAVNVDYEKRYESHNVWKLLKGWYNRYVAKEEIEGVFYDTLAYRMNKLHGAIKEYLDMEAKGNEYAGYLGDNV